MTAPRSGPGSPQAPGQVRLRETSFADHAAVVALEAHGGLKSRSYADWSGMWLGNPAYERLGPDWPIGWVLENDAGRIVGTIGNLPLPYWFEGRELVVATGRGWSVEEEYRGFALLLMDQYFAQDRVDLFLNTTVNEKAVEAFGVFGSARVPAGDWSAASFWVTRHRQFARAALRVKGWPLPGVCSFPAGVALRVRDVLAGPRLPTSPVQVTQLAAFDERFDDLSLRLRASRPGVLLGGRDRRCLEWHFGAGLRRGEVWILAVTDGSRLSAYAIYQARHDERYGLRRMRQVDLQLVEGGEAAAVAITLRALEMCREHSIDALENVGRDLRSSEIFDRFAPYRRPLTSWPFYFAAPDPRLSAKLSSANAWDPSNFDGDSSL